MGERGYLLKEQNKSKIAPKAASSQERKNSCMFVLKIAQFRSKAASSIQAEKSLNFAPKQSEKTAMFEAEKSLNFAPKQPLRSERKNSCMFEAEKSLNFALKQPLRREKKTAACSRLKNRSISL